MRASRALPVAAAALVWLLIGIAPVPVGAQTAPLGAVNVVQDGWWSRANGGNPPITSPSLPFPVPAKGLAVAASNGEPDKVSALGITISVDPARFARLIVNLRETADNGANSGTASSGATGTVGGAIRACPATAAWAAAKAGPWAKQPPFDPNQCVNGARSTDVPAVWSFDISAAARQWMDGSLAQNGVVLVENVNAPVTFQAAWGDSTTPDVTLSLDLVPEEEPSTSFEPITPGGDTSFSDTPTASDPSASFAPTQTFEFSSGDSFTTPQLRPTPAVPRPAASVATPIAARTGAAKPPDLSGNIPLGVALLGILALALALAVSYALGPAGNPAGVAVHRQGGVSRALARRAEPSTEAPNS
jgi:hypothetical protein